MALAYWFGTASDSFPKSSPACREVSQQRECACNEIASPSFGPHRSIRREHGKGRRPAHRG